KALREARQAHGFEATFVPTRFVEGLALLLLDRPEECAALDLHDFPGVKAMCLASSGKRDEAEALIAHERAEIDAGKCPTPMHAGNIVLYDAWKGDAESTSLWL